MKNGWQLLLEYLDFTYNHELSGVFISIVDSKNATVDGDIKANREVGGHEGLLRAIALEDHVSLKEWTLGNSTVLLLRLSDHDGLVFEVVEDHSLSDSEVF